LAQHAHKAAQFAYVRAIWLLQGDNGKHMFSDSTPASKESDKTANAPSDSVFMPERSCSVPGLCSSRIFVLAGVRSKARTRVNAAEFAAKT
jgi:hypothetical protein